MEASQRIYMMVKHKLLSKYQELEEDIELNANSVDKSAEEKSDAIVDHLMELSVLDNANAIWDSFWSSDDVNKQTENKGE